MMGFHVAVSHRTPTTRAAHKLTPPQRRALREYTIAAAAEDRYLGSVFVTPAGQAAVEARTAAAYAECIRLGMTHEHGL